MFNIDGKYGCVHINGQSINIEEKNIDELKKFLGKLDEKQEELIEQQNKYLSQIIG